jgi:hypothetical protein
VILAAFHPVILGTESFYFRDFGLFGYPLAYYHRECFWRGEVPLWNPFNGLGLPFLAQWNTLTLYPGSLIYLLLPLPWSLNVYCLAHLFLAGLGMYFLALAWTNHRLAAAVAGLAFALNGLLLSSLKWPNNIAVLGWMPWVVLVVEQAWEQGGRRLLLAALLGAVQMLAGTPELILLTWLVLSALWLGKLWLTWRKQIVVPVPLGLVVLRFPLVVLLVAGLAAAQLLPFFDFLGECQRSAQFGAESWAMPGWGWANFLVPLFHCFRSHQGVFAQYDQYWISSYYVSVPVVVLALWGIWSVRRRRVWLGALVVAVCLVLALGKTGGLYAWLLRAFPPLGLMRFPIKFVVPVVLLLPLLGACAIAHWDRLQPAARRQAGRQLGGLVALAIVLIGIIVGVAWFDARKGDEWTATWQNAARRAGLLVLAAAFWYQRQQAKRAQARLLLAFGLLLALVVDVLFHTPWQNPTVPRWALGPGLAELQPAPRLGHSRAMLSPAAENQLDHWIPPNPTQDYLASRLGLFCDCNLIEAMPKVDGFYSLYPRDTSLLLGLLYRSNSVVYPPLADFLAVSHITTEGKMFAWTSRTNQLPLITAGQRPVFADRGETLRTLASPEFRPPELVYLPPEAKGAITVTGAAPARVFGSRWSAHRVEFQVQAAQPAWVVVAQSFYPCWRAYVNTEPARLWRANLAFQALEVPAGRSQVELVYTDLPFRAGAAMSLLSLAVCGAAWRRLWPRRSG